MTLSDARPPESGEAGWYADPLGSGRSRYYDGAKWTERISGEPASGTLEPNPGGSGWGWWRRLPTWGKWTVGVVSALVLLGVGAAVGGSGSKEDELKDEVAAVKADLKASEAEVATAETRADAAREQVSDIEAEVGSLTEQAEAKADGILSEAQSEKTELDAKLERQRREVKRGESEVESVEAEIDGVRGELGDAKEEAAKSEISDGVWTLEKDYVPGVYESPGGGGCYWALKTGLGGGGVEDIIENGGFNEHQVLEITSPYFETRGCGTWHKVG